MSERRLGIIYALLAYGIWGVLPLYLKLLSPASPLEVVAHRIAWSALLLVAVVAVTRQLDWLRQVRERPRTLWTFVFSSLALTVNWVVYIWAVAQGRVIDASLGYFINPLVSVVLAVLVLKERLRPGQWVAVGLAALGVLWLSLAARPLPWIGLTLAVAFGAYGLLRKTTHVDALGGLTLETLLLLPAATLYLLYLNGAGHSSWPAGTARLHWLLVAAGPITAVPLLCFAAGARRIPLSLVGLLQYLGPTLQLGLGVLVFREPLSTRKLAGFSLIWLALLLYTLEGSLARRRARQ